MTRAATANGSEMKKFQRQLIESVMKPPSSGPPTVETAMTAPKRPMYLPRSRGLMMSAMSTWLSAARPPAPMPCTARIAMSRCVSCEKPAMAVATTKITIASWYRNLRLVRSASLPQIGVEIAVVRSVAVTTQVYEVCVPPRSETMTGSELETTVDASIDTNMPRIRPESASSTWRCDIFGGAEEGVDIAFLTSWWREPRRRWRRTLTDVKG